jgi:hypothetical protein
MLARPITTLLKMLMSDSRHQPGIWTVNDQNVPGREYLWNFLFSRVPVIFPLLIQEKPSLDRIRPGSVNPPKAKEAFPVRKS